MTEVDNIHKICFLDSPFQNRFFAIFCNILQYGICKIQKSLHCFCRICIESHVFITFFDILCRQFKLLVIDLQSCFDDNIFILIACSCLICHVLHKQVGLCKLNYRWQVLCLDSGLFNTRQDFTVIQPDHLCQFIICYISEEIHCHCIAFKRFSRFFRQFFVSHAVQVNFITIPVVPRQGQTSQGKFVVIECSNRFASLLAIEAVEHLAAFLAACRSINICFNSVHRWHWVIMNQRFNEQALLNHIPDVSSLNSIVEYHATLCDCLCNLFRTPCNVCLNHGLSLLVYYSTLQYHIAIYSVYYSLFLCKKNILKMISAKKNQCVPHSTLHCQPQQHR